jgi:hypothetical protein
LGIIDRRSRQKMMDRLTPVGMKPMGQRIVG